MKSWVKLEDVFLIRRGEKKICAGEFDFCRGEFAMTTVHPFSFFHREKLNKSENSCHSLHGCCNRLNINTLPCNVLVFRMSLMSLDCKSDISDMAFLLVIARGELENQRVATLVQWVTWVLRRWKNSPSQKTNTRRRIFILRRRKSGKTWRRNLKTSATFENSSSSFGLNKYF